MIRRNRVCSESKRRVAIISHIHDNLTAFQAVRADLRETSPDFILQGGASTLQERIYRCYVQKIAFEEQKRRLSPGWLVYSGYFAGKDHKAFVLRWVLITTVS